MVIQEGEELHIFLNFDHDTNDAFSLILSGGPGLNEIIDTTEKLASLKQRITNHYNFKGLSDEAIPLYLKHKLEFAGGNTLLLDDDALRCLCTASGGIYCTIGHIMTDALAYGHRQAETVSMQKSCRSLLITSPLSQENAFPQKLLTAAVLR